jgi:hypothetical protein
MRGFDWRRRPNSIDSRLLLGSTYLASLMRVCDYDEAVVGCVVCVLDGSDGGLTDESASSALCPLPVKGLGDGIESDGLGAN